MKRLILILITLMIGLIFLSSCGKKPSYAKVRVYDWTGEITEIKGIFEPYSIHWVTPSRGGWIKHKTFGKKSDDLRTIINCLCYPEEEKENIISEESLHELLWLFFFDARNPEKLTLVKIRFIIRGETFIGPRGNSQKLGKLLLEAEECGPYHKLIDPNRVEEVQMRLREKVKEMREQKQSEEQSE